MLLTMSLPTVTPAARALAQTVRAALGALVPLDAFDGRWMRWCEHGPTARYALAMEVVVRTPGLHAPTYAHVWTTDLYRHADRGVVLTEPERAHLLWGATGRDHDPEVTRYHAARLDEILLCEVVDTCGDDGHVGYRLRGHTFLTARDLSAAMEQAARERRRHDPSTDPAQEYERAVERLLRDPETHDLRVVAGAP